MSNTIVPQDVIEGNAKIAKFVGYKYKPNDTLNGIKGVYRKKNMMPMTISDFKYHLSWSRLMPVVKTVMMATIDGDDYLREINDGLIEAFCKVDIFMMWKTVIEFIQWYNEQSKKLTQ